MGLDDRLRRAAAALNAGVERRLEKERCPAEGCPVEAPADDLQAQSEHLLACHPEIVAERRAASARWDGWEQD